MNFHLKGGMLSFCGRYVHAVKTAMPKFKNGWHFCFENLRRVYPGGVSHPSNDFSILVKQICCLPANKFTNNSIATFFKKNT